MNKMWRKFRGIKKLRYILLKCPDPRIAFRDPDPHIFSLKRKALRRKEFFRCEGFFINID